MLRYCLCFILAIIAAEYVHTVTCTTTTSESDLSKPSRFSDSSRENESSGQKAPSDPVPRCEYRQMRVQNETLPWSLDASVASFECRCSSKTQRYKGLLSDILEDPMSTIPMHLMGDKLNISVEIKQCQKLRLTVDFDELMHKRPGSFHGADFSLKISHCRRVQINHIRLTPYRSHVLSFSWISGRVTVTGKIDCASCTDDHSGSAIHLDSLPTMLNLHAKSVNALEINRLEATSPFSVTSRNVGSLSVMFSRLATIPWPGFYIYNTTSVTIKGNDFLDVAPRAVVVKSGQHLLVTDNVLAVSSALDVSQFSQVTIKCNRENSRSILPQSCLPPLFPKEKDLTLDNWHSSKLTVGFSAVVFNIIGHFWLLIIIAAFILIAGYKFVQGTNEVDESVLLQNHLKIASGPNVISGNINQSNTSQMFYEIAPQRSHRSYEGETCKCLPCINRNLEKSGGKEDMDEDEYSNSSRLHLASDQMATINGTLSNIDYCEAGQRSLNYGESNQFSPSPYIMQLDRLSLSANGIDDYYYPNSAAANAVNNHLSQRQNNNYHSRSKNASHISHIDSEVEDLADGETDDICPPLQPINLRLGGWHQQPSHPSSKYHSKQHVDYIHRSTSSS